MYLNVGFFYKDNLMITSLCPELGMTYSVVSPGMCPSHLQNLTGKELTIGILGMLPFVVRNENKEIIGGVELQIIELYAKKFGFKPRYIYPSSFGGMIDSVLIVNINKHTK